MVQLASRQGEIFNTARSEELWKALAVDGQLNESEDGKQLLKVARATYDFDVDGGAISNIDIGGLIPVNAIIKRAYYQVQTTFKSSSDAASIGIRVNGASPVVLVTPVTIATGTPWDAGLQEGIPDGTMAAALAVPETGQIQLTIAAEVVTEGKLVVFIEYVLGE